MSELVGTLVRNNLRTHRTDATASVHYPVHQLGERSKQIKQNFSHAHILFCRHVNVLTLWPICLVASIGFEGEGQSLQFVPTCRHDDMIHTRCTIFLGTMAKKPCKEIRNSSRIGPSDKCFVSMSSAWHLVLGNVSQWATRFGKFL